MIMRGQSEQCQSVLPKCPICTMEPLPESAQPLFFWIIECLMLLFNFKLAIIALVLGYTLSHISWLCPQCKRQVDVRKEPVGVSDNIIIRMGNCMVFLSHTKFRIIAAIVITWLLYLYAHETTRKKETLVKTWEAMADSCGYEVFVENSFKSNSIFSKYLASGDDWIIEGVYLATISQPNGSIKLALKMDPTQFNNPDTEDCLLVGSNVDMELQRGDVVRAYGGWYGRQSHNFVFRLSKLERTGVKKNPADIKLLELARNLLRERVQNETEKHG